MFYTYLHKTVDGEVFYVGKGKAHRAWAKSGRNRSAAWHEMVSRRGLIVEICAYWPTEKEAYEHEKVLLACFKDMGAKLLNMTAGGGGASGMKQTLESNALRAAALLGRKRPPEIGQKIAEKLRGRARVVIPEIEARRVAAAIKARARRIRCVDTGQVFASLSDAAKFVSGSPGNICSVANGARAKAYGYVWEYA